MRLTPIRMQAAVEAALAEDLGAGDVTTELLLAESDPRGLAFIEARESLVLAGLPVAEAVFRHVDPQVSLHAVSADGDHLAPGAVVAEVSGPAGSLLMAERTALNFLGRLSGIATLTYRYRQAMGETKARLLSTRKTTPGLRALETYAVAVGGGTVHRTDLHDGILLKDNHIAVAGSIEEAVRRLRERSGPARAVEVEVENLDELEEAISAGADVVLLDNFTHDEVVEAVAAADGRVRLEVSGGVDHTNVAELAATGVDAVSAGRLTHSAPAVDLSMRLEKPGPVGAGRSSERRPPED